MLVNAYLLQLSAPLNMLGMMYREVKQALTNIERLFGLLDEAPGRAGPPRRGAAARRAAARRASSTCASATTRAAQILHGRRFRRSRPAATVAVVGHSGSGKSTLARLLYRFYDVDAGRITITDADGTRATSATTPRHSVRAAIAIVPQDTVLFNDTIYYNILYGRPDATREEVEARRARRAHPRPHRRRCPTATKPKSASAA